MQRRPRRGAPTLAKMASPSPPLRPPPPLLAATATAAAAFLATTLPLATFDGTLFSLHPAALALALSLATRGALTARGARALEGDARAASLWAHAAWQGAAVCVWGGGVAAVWANKVGERDGAVVRGVEEETGRWW